MYRIKLVFIFLSYCSFTYGQNNTSEHKYVKIIVNNVSTSADALIIDNYMRQQYGMVMSRMDYRTALYFCTYKTSSNLSAELIKTMLLNLGYSSQCSVTGYHGSGERLKPLNKRICIEDIPTQENKL